MALKMSREHQEYIKEAIEEKVGKHGGWQRVVERYETGDFPNADRTDNLQLRFVSDLFYASIDYTWIRDNLYPYLNDGNIYNAVKRMVPTLVDRRPADRRPWNHKRNPLDR